MTDSQIKRIAEIIHGEDQNSLEGMKAVASQMCNLYEYRVWCNSSDVRGKTFYEWVSTTSWYGGRTSTTSTSKEIQAVQDCIVNGQRTLPLYVDEYCTFAPRWVTPYYSDISRYISGQTVVTQKFAGNPKGIYWIAFKYSRDR